MSSPHFPFLKSFLELSARLYVSTPRSPTVVNAVNLVCREFLNFLYVLYHFLSPLPFLQPSLLHLPQYSLKSTGSFPLITIVIVYLYCIYVYIKSAESICVAPIYMF